MLKRGFAVFFLIVFLANCVGFSFLSLLEIQKHRHFMSLRTAKDEAAVTLSIPLAEISKSPDLLIWLHKREVIFKGNRYDVISSAQQNGILKLICINDSKEEMLLHKWSEHNNGNENNLPAKNKNVHVKKVLDDFVKDSHLIFSEQLSSNFLMKNPTNHPEIVELSITTPPPRLV